jgi:hypothetical protein
MNKISPCALVSIAKMKLVNSLDILNKKSLRRNSMIGKKNLIAFRKELQFTLTLTSEPIKSMKSKRDNFLCNTRREYDT